MFKSDVVYHAVLLSLLVFFAPFAVSAMEVKISEDLEYVEIVQNDRTTKIQRNQDQNNLLVGGFSKTSRKCPPFCIQPIHVAEGVTTVGELELLDFIKDKVNNGTGLIIDARTPSWHEKGTIPGSINIPFTIFAKDGDKFVLGDAMRSLGGRRINNHSIVQSMWTSVKRLYDSGYQPSQWDFSEAKNILLWCNGMWCGQSPRAIKGLLALGYPAEKIFYYRGGMQSWQLLGLTVVAPDKKRYAQY